MEYQGIRTNQEYGLTRDSCRPTWIAIDKHPYEVSLQLSAQAIISSSLTVLVCPDIGTVDSNFICVENIIPTLFLLQDHSEWWCRRELHCRHLRWNKQSLSEHFGDWDSWQSWLPGGGAEEQDPCPAWGSVGGHGWLLLGLGKREPCCSVLRIYVMRWLFEVPSWCSKRYAVSKYCYYFFLQA